ncbi:TetR/AcrR family transcriptional regulator [Isosphaeraceae bacterium EP7]
MKTSERKQREVQQREELLLALARTMLIEQGYAGLSMDRLAEASEYSKGTVYHHFATKEDLVTALAVQSNAQRIALFDRARVYNGRPRERMVALGFADELFARLHPHYFHAEMIVRMADLGDRATAERLGAFGCQDDLICGWVCDIVRDAERAGDIVLKPPTTAGSVAFGVFTLAIGTHEAMTKLPHTLNAFEIGDPFAVMSQNIQHFLDGLGWRPLVSEWDYAETLRKVAREIFADECNRVGLATS